MRPLVDAASTVLFDFDGPLCALFHGRPAPQVAERLRTLADGFDEGGQSKRPLPDTRDPYVILASAVDTGRSRELTTLLEKALTEEECEAAPLAYPTPYADRLVHTLRATGRRLAVASNNSPSAVERYLRTRATDEVFAGHIHGRTPDELRLKPDPYCLERALASTATAPADALMIGDAARDFEAARALGVPFLGYASTEGKAARLRASGAEHVVDSLAPVLRAVDPAARV